MARDFYADALEIAERLRDAGADEWADRIDRPVREGFSATEILMGIRRALTELLAADLTIEESTLELAQGLRSAIDAALSP
jgi:hypothetical protein